MFFSLGNGFGFKVQQRSGSGYEDLLPDLAVSPTSYNYGEHDTGTNTDYIFTLTNSGNEVAEDITVAVTGTGFSLLSSAGPFNVAADGGTANVTVRFAPTTGDALTGSLTISWPNRDDIVAGLSGVRLHDPVPTTYSSVTIGTGQVDFGSTNNYGIVGQLITGAVTHELCEASFDVNAIVGNVESKSYYIKVFSRTGTTLDAVPKATSSVITGIIGSGWVTGTFSTPVTVNTGDVIALVAPIADASNYLKLNNITSNTDAGYSNRAGYHLTGRYEITNTTTQDLNYIFKELA